MASESGFTTQKKIGEAQHKTIHNLGSDRFGTSVTTKALSEVNAVAAAIINSDVSQDQKSVYIEITANGARKGDILRMSSGTLVGWEFEIVEIVDADIFGIINSADSIPQIADTAKIMRWVTSKADAEGNLNFSPGPTTFIQDAATVSVNEDTAVPANNKPLPTGMYFYKDGVATAVATDSVVPSNTVPMPVEIFGAGTTINLTAGDINVQLSSEGPTFDSTRIGDGSGVYLGINASTEALVHDADTLAELVDANASLAIIEPLTGGIVETEAVIDAAAVPLIAGTRVVPRISEYGMLYTRDLWLSQEVNGMAADISIARAELQSIDSQIGNLATHAKQDELKALLPSSIGQKVAADSLSVVLASGTALSVSSTTLATEAKQDDIINELQDIELDVEAVALKLPSTIGQKLPADSLSVVLATGSSISATITGGATEAKQDTQITAVGSTNTKLDSLLTELQLKADLTESQPVVIGALTGSYQEIVNLTNVAQTFTAPANAKWCKIQADDTNAVNIRVKIGAAATVSSGMQFQPGRSEDYQIAGDISVIAESASANQKIYVQFGV